MLQLKNIVKQYTDVQSTTTAVDDLTIRFRKHEFVSILGPSGCGKTSLLNIIGGLDQYTSGDMLINGVSTSKFTEKQWNNYRNHSIGFVFQSYNLITHQTVFKNVELALTLTGVSKQERKQRVIDALERVGLSDHINKKPNQLSGGQMQRVAIARALVNSPDIILADEPTGALDSENSDLVMQLLKDISKERLVIVVTHNPELAKEYSTRIIKLSNGKLIKDTNPYEGKRDVDQKMLKPSSGKHMSFISALMLSLSNLLTKKARTILTSIAGSIGIIGIALILSVSTGVNAYIADVQRDTLMANPLTIQRQNQDFSTIISSMLSAPVVKDPQSYDQTQIHINNSMSNVMSSSNNDLKSFYSYLKQHYNEIDPYLYSIKYTYGINMPLFTYDGSTQVNPSKLFSGIDDTLDGVSNLLSSMSNVSLSVLSELIDDQNVLEEQYDIVGGLGHWPKEFNEIVLVVDKNNELNKVSLYMLGLITQDQLLSDEVIPAYSVQDLVGMEFKLVNTCDFFVSTDFTYQIEGGTYPIWQDIRDGVYNQEEFVSKKGIPLVVSAVVKPKSTTTAYSITGLLGHTSALTEYLVNYAQSSEVVIQQQKTPTHNVLTGVEFKRQTYTKDTIHELISKVDDHVMSQVYDYITELLKTDEEFISYFTISDTESFMNFFLTMSDEDQQAIVADMLNSCLTYNSTQLTMLLSGIQKPGIELNTNNIVTAIPLLTDDELIYLMSDSTGLLSMCDSSYIDNLFISCSNNLRSMTVDEDSFLLFLQSGFITDEYFREVEDMLYQLAPQKDATYESVLSIIGHADKTLPESISFYAKDFESREFIEKFISRYNEGQENKITYTDVTKSVLNVIQSIILVVSCVLIAFISISLIVSSLMTGVITYVSVLERRKEIGILRAVGASKSDIRHIFNAETCIIGFTAGLIGVIVTYILNIFVNNLLLSATNIPNLHATLTLPAALLLVFVSIFLTFIAGLIPANVAAKLNPVEALRSE